MLTLALTLLLQAQPAAPPRGEFVGPYVFREHKDHVTKVVLKNGLTVLVQEQSIVPLASITTYVKAGYFDEEDRLSGLSHVIEHMFFKGTATRSVGEIARETKGLGGYLNAYTSYERTVYRTVVPAENVLEALDIQADALWHPTFDADELRREIEVVLQENNRKLDNPGAVASEKLYATAFEQHRMRRWRIGTAEGLRSLTRDDVVTHYQKFYRPSNIILVVVGRVDLEQVLAEVVKLYGSAPADDPDAPFVREPSPTEPSQVQTRHAAERGAIEQAHIALGFHTPGILTQEARTLEVLGAILGSGRASRLIRTLRDQKNLITDGAAGLMGFRDLGFFEISMRTPAPVEAQIALLTEIEMIKRSGVTQEDLGRAKMMIAQDYLHRLETVDALGDELAIHEARGDWKGMSQYLSEIEKVDRARILEVSRKYLTHENLSAFEYLPAGLMRAVSENFRTAVLDKLDASVEKQLAEVAAARDQELPVTAEMPDLTAGLASEIVGTVQRRSMSRGPDIYILEDHRLPLVSFGIFYPGGRLYETPKNAGITELMLRSALRGSRQFDSAGIARRLENAGARIRIVNEADFFGYIVDGVAGKIDQALTVLMDVLHQPRFDEQQITAEKEQQIARIRSLRDDNTAYPVSLFMRSLFGDHPYARPAAGSEDSVSKLTNTELRDWFRNNQRTLVPSIVIVGDARGTGLVAPHADALTNEDLVVRDLKVLPRPQPAESAPETSEAIRRNQTALVYGFPGASRNVEDRYALEVFVNIVSGLGGRFFEAIREREGLAYTVRTTNASWTKGGAIYTYTAFSPENEQQVRVALDMQHERLRKEGVTAEELARAIEYSIGERDIALQTRDAQVLEFARTIYAGDTVQAVARHSAGLQAVTLDRIRSVVQQYLDAGLLRIGVVRGTP